MRKRFTSCGVLFQLAAVFITCQFVVHKVAAQCASSGQQCGNSATGPKCCTTGNYCQPWDPNNYQCRPKPAQCGVPEVNVDYNGNDLAHFVGMKLPDECCSKCAVTSRCAAFTFINYGWDGKTHCYLKTGTGTKKTVAGAISAVVNSCSVSNGGSCGTSTRTTCCPSKTYCQPWNPNQYQCKDVPAKCSTQLTDTDFNGNDMGVSFGLYPWDCCAKCASTPGCVGYTFVNTDPRGRACYLKSSTDGIRTSVGAVSGIVNSPLAATHIQSKIRSGAARSRAVNLGGWLVSEYWMSWESAVYKGISSDVAWQGEYTVMKTLSNLIGRTAAIARFEQHRQTWITEADIKEIAATGVLNTVRVPVGHWIIRDATSAGAEASMYAPGGLKFLDTLINDWAVKYNIAVIISLHAHQGSQNGMEHSSPSTPGKVGWTSSQANIDSSVKFATFLADRYKNSQAFLGLNLMNEPTPPVDRTAMQNYYISVYNQIRGTGNNCILLVSPMLGEQDPDHLYGMIGAPQYTNVWNDIHVYFIWGYGDKSEREVLAAVDTYRETHLKRAPTNNRLFMGEWCMGGPPDQNGIFQDLNNFRELGSKQLAYFNSDATGGWAFWSWRHSDETVKRTGWSMRYLLRNGYLKLS